MPAPAFVFVILAFPLCRFYIALGFFPFPSSSGLQPAHSDNFTIITPWVKSCNMSLQQVPQRKPKETCIAQSCKQQPLPYALCHESLIRQSRLYPSHTLCSGLAEVVPVLWTPQREPDTSLLTSSWFICKHIQINTVNIQVVWTCVKKFTKNSDFLWNKINKQIPEN